MSVEFLWELHSQEKLFTEEIRENNVCVKKTGFSITFFMSYNHLKHWFAIS